MVAPQRVFSLLCDFFLSEGRGFFVVYRVCGGWNEFDAVPSWAQMGSV